MRRSFGFGWLFCLCALSLIPQEVRSRGIPLTAVDASSSGQQAIAGTTARSAEDEPGQVTPKVETSKDWNHRLEELLQPNSAAAVAARLEQDRIGPEDVLDINVFGAPELTREVRVSSSGTISLPLVGEISAVGLTPRELERVLESLLHPKYLNDPHVSVFVRDMQSHPVSVIGAVRKPGVFQIRGGKTLLEVLSLAEGVADDAGETVVIMHGAGVQNEQGPPSAEKSVAFTGSPLTNQRSTRQGAGQSAALAPALGPGEDDVPSTNTVQVNLKDLLESADPNRNPEVYPGDIVKVTRAGVVYVIGAVGRPGGFVMKTNEGMSVLQAMALSGGVTKTAAKSGARIIHTDEGGARTKTPIDLGKVISGKVPDPVLTAGDIVFVPDSAAKIMLSRGAEGAAQTLSGLLIFHW